MKKVLLIGAALAGLVLCGACNRQKPPTLDYSQKMEKEVYMPQGLPGDSHVGRSKADEKYNGLYVDSGQPKDTANPDTTDKPADDGKDDGKKAPPEEKKGD